MKGRNWLLLLYALPSRKGSSRVNLWRQLKKSGAIALKTSTYILPDEPQHRERFQWLAQQVRENGGDATLIYATDIEGTSDDEIVRMFNAARGEDYAAFVAEIETVIAANRRKPGENYATALERFAARFEEIRQLDFFDAPQAEEVRRDPTLKLAFSGGIGTFFLDFFDQWDPKSPWHDKRVRQAASYAIDRRGISEAETLGASKPAGNIVPRTFEFALPFEPDPYDPAKARQLLAEAGYPNGFDAGDLHAYPPYNSMTEAIGNNLAAVGIRTKMRTMERAAFFSAWASKKLRGVCMCVLALYGNAASRMSAWVPSSGAFAYGGYPDVDALYNQQAGETDRRKREALLHQIQQIVHDRVRLAPIWDYTWPSGVGPRVADPALMLINPYPWSAPLEDVRLKK